MQTDATRRALARAARDPVDQRVVAHAGSAPAPPATSSVSILAGASSIAACGTIVRPAGGPHRRAVGGDDWSVL